MSKNLLSGPLSLVPTPFTLKMTQLAGGMTIKLLFNSLHFLEKSEMNAKMIHLKRVATLKN